MKFGKKPATHDARDLCFEHYATVALTPPTSDTDNLSRVPNWAMLGNDHYGDCVWAGAAHETELWTRLAGGHASFSDQSVLSDYAAVTGFNPSDPNSDQGTDVRQALDYRRSTGILDAAGRRHKIAAYVALEPGNVAHVKEAVHLVDGVGIGIRFPNTAMQQFRAGQPWTVVPGATIEGGHYVPVIGYTSRSVYVVTWGKVQRASWQFFTTYCDEAFALLSPEFLKAGLSPEGFDLAALQADLAAL